jgi:hypothetical protein
MRDFANEPFQCGQNTVFGPRRKPAGFLRIHFHLADQRDRDQFAGAEFRGFVSLRKDGNQDAFDQQVLRADDVHRTLARETQPIPGWRA